MRAVTRSMLAAVPLTLMLALAGCGSDDGGEGVASAGGGKNGGSSGQALSQEEMGVKFAQCMREHGIDMEDPKPGQGIMVRGKPGQEAAMEKAMEACRKYNPMDNGSAGSDPAAQERGRKFAQCMRDNGVEAFPDPQPGQVGVRVDGKTAEDPDFEAANQKCRSHLSGGQNGGAGQ